MPDHSLFGPLAASASAMGAERLRMSVASENLAHAGDTERRANGLPYARQRVTFSSVLDQLGHDTGTIAANVVASPRYSQRYEPDHPNADPVTGIVKEADIDPVLELTDLMVASRSYDANANAARGLMHLNDTALRLADNS
jgi:flagellar basal-body rod protein FlgC